MFEDLQAELDRAIQAVLDSAAPKKLIVAGPGTGKTWLFRRVLEQIDGQHNALVLTFINNLKNDLERELGALGDVFTFHGYCRSLLHRQPNLRAGLTEGFRYYPPLTRLVQRDWELLEVTEAPEFIRLIRELDQPDLVRFYLDRANFYDAVGFDDSVFRVYNGLRDFAGERPRYAILLVDEYQDFNQLEVSFIDLLATRSPTIIAGDDDQALYVVRSSSSRYIRERHAEGEYQTFALPFCMRCTEPIVEAVMDVVAEAQRRGYLRDRIVKPYMYYPPTKGADTALYPRLQLIEVSAQSLRANYFGRYVEQQIQLIPQCDIDTSVAGGFPTVLIIGPTQYLRQVYKHLDAGGYACMFAERDNPTQVVADDGLRLLREEPQSNLGWRIMLATDDVAFADDVVRATHELDRSIRDLVPPDYAEEVLRRAHDLPEEAPVVEPPTAEPGITIRMTSFEGSKGLSAHHVFIVGLHEGDLPRGPRPTDIDICKFIVALTRTRKQCHLLFTTRWGAQARRPSQLLEWINPDRLRRLRVDRNYW